MLTEALKEEIQTAYSRLLENKGYTARHCQKVMVAEIARSLGGLIADVPDSTEPLADPVNLSSQTVPNTCVIEAGTGTGKTIAYAIAAIPVAKALKKKIVIATATVALQEQIVYQDLPDIRHHSGLDFSFVLAKGRRRYLCLSRLDLALQESSSMNHTLALYDGEGGDVELSDIEVYESMLAKLGNGDWDGDRDSWKVELEQSTWNRVSTDHAQCTGRRCSHYENCYFYRARENIHRVECIVTNHDLVLADLMMGGGAVLPDPSDVIYIFDEGHHLPEKAQNHFSHYISLYSTRNWLQQVPQSFGLLTGELEIYGAYDEPVFANHINDSLARIDELAGALQVFQAEAQNEDDGWRYRFPMGVVGQEIMQPAQTLARIFTRIQSDTEIIHRRIEDLIEDGAAGESAETWLSIVSAIDSRLDAAIALWGNFSAPDRKGAPPYARWINFRNGALEGMEITLSSSPISVADELYERLWSRSFGVVITSATLSVGRDFSNFRLRTGIAPENRFVSLPSPFNFPEKGILRIPKLPVDPGMVEEHTRCITELIPELLQNDMGSLVLFTSWRQMLAVFDNIDAVFRERILCQGNFSKIEILLRHKAAVDAREESCIFGLASFAEGIDLPGDYCTHVVIAKIPFAVPDDPVAATLSEWIEDRGGNSFQEIMVPQAALRMVQASGRLLRTETDSGRVTVLDRRLVTRSYGRIILNALPPFARETE